MDTYLDGGSNVKPRRMKKMNKMKQSRAKQRVNGNGNRPSDVTGPMIRVTGTRCAS